MVWGWTDCAIRIASSRVTARCCAAPGGAPTATSRTISHNWRTLVPRWSVFRVESLDLLGEGRILCRGQLGANIREDRGQGRLHPGPDLPPERIHLWPVAIENDPNAIDLYRAEVQITGQLPKEPVGGGPRRLHRELG